MSGKITNQINPVNNNLSDALNFKNKDSKSPSLANINFGKSLNQLNQTIEKTNDQTKPQTNETQDFWVTKTTDSKTLKDKLLTEHFNFDKSDIEAYELRNGAFVINDEKKCEIAKSDGKACTWATSDDIKNWRTENGKVPVTLSAQTIKNLQNFRQERLIDRVTSTISDENLRNQVKNDLLQVATSDNQTRNSAANRLMYLENVGEKDLQATREAIQTIVSQPENKNNPMTNLVAAKFKLEDAIKREDLRGVFDAEAQMNKAVKLIQGQDAITGEIKKDAKVNREEAAWLNRQVANTLRGIGREKEANERETLARYYEVDDAERGKVFGYPLGEIDRWKKTDNPSVRPISEAEQNWQEFQDAYSTEPQMKKRLGESKFKYEWKVPKFIEGSILEVGGTQNNPNIRETALEREKFSGSLRVTGITKVETQVNVDKKGRPIPSNRPYYNNNQEFFRNTNSYRRTMQSPELNQNGINRGLGAARSVDILGVINSNVPFYADLYYGKTEKVLALRNELEKANKTATKFPVPPKPEDLPKERERLTRLFGSDLKGKMSVNEIMRDLEIKSHAFWNR